MGCQFKTVWQPEGSVRGLSPGVGGLQVCLQVRGILRNFQMWKLGGG